MSSNTRISISVRSSPPRALYFCVRLYSVNPQGLHTVCWCSPPRTLYFCVLQYGASPNGLCAVRAYKGFVLLCTVRAPRALCGASLQRLYTVCTRACASVYCTSPKSVVRCEPTKGLCFCVLYEPQELCAVRAYKGFIQCAPGLVLLCTVRAPRALCGASLQRICASVHCTSPKSLCTVRVYKGFLQRAGARPPGFAPSAYVLVRSYEQMSSCTRTCTYVLYELTHYLCFCTGVCR